MTAAQLIQQIQHGHELWRERDWRNAWRYVLHNPHTGQQRVLRDGRAVMHALKDGAIEARTPKGNNGRPAASEFNRVRFTLTTRGALLARA